MYKQKLIDLLKSDEQVRTAIEKLEFGCKFIFDGIGFIYSGDKNADESILEGIESGDTKIIGLPLQERFIRMYCLHRGLNCNFQSNNLIFIWRDYLDKDDKNKEEGKLIPYASLEDFDQQDVEVYQKIYEELNNL